MMRRSVARSSVLFRSVLLPALVCPLILVATAGCRLSGYYLTYPTNPIDGVRKIAVAPVTGPAHTDPFEIGDAIATELIQCPDVTRVVRPREFQHVLESNGITLTSESSVQAMARILGVDGVLIAELTEYSPYHPPRIGIVAQLFITRTETSSGTNIVGISRQGRSGPIERLGAGNLVQIERVYDASNRETYSRAAAYAFGHEHDQEAIAGGDRILWIQDLYFRFVSYSLVRDLFQKYSTRLEASATAELSARNTLDWPGSRAPRSG